MADIIEFSSFLKAKTTSLFTAESKMRADVKDQARELLYEAASLLISLGDKEHRVGWIVEDCADVLLDETKNIDDFEAQEHMDFLHEQVLTVLDQN